MIQDFDIVLAKDSPGKNLGRILVIEDEAVLRVTFKQFLSEEGFDVATAPNGMEGVEICREFRPDLVITDLLMPVQDGYTTIEILRRDFPDLPIIAMSAVMGSAGRHESLSRGAMCCVTKPVDVHLLLKVVRQYISTSGGRSPH
ncbi:MAG: response regulator [Candidatus Hydrogenedentes bacterium]|nr:response regulator [Candidatus Hydrogenedentota bacterium]